MPTKNREKTHVSCATDPSNSKGKALNLTLYLDDDDPNNVSGRQRIEMKVDDSSPPDLLATKDSSYIYTWSFYLNPQLKAGSNNT